MFKKVQDEIREMSPSKDSIPPKVFKYGSNEKLIKKQVELFKSIWKVGHVPQDVKETFINHVWKIKKIMVSVIIHGIFFFIVLQRFWLESFWYHRHDLSLSGCRKSSGKKSRTIQVFVDLIKAFDTITEMLFGRSSRNLVFVKNVLISSFYFIKEWKLLF